MCRESLSWSALVCSETRRHRLHPKSWRSLLGGRGQSPPAGSDALSYSPRFVLTGVAWASLVETCRADTL